jgi:serine/threonine protein kinase
MAGGNETIPDLSVTNPDFTDEGGENLVGVRLGNFVLKEVIGRGGMGIVYRAEHVYIHKPAAVKVLHPRYFDNNEARHRFLHEAQTASVIDHPNIIGVNDFGEAPDGTIFLVMAHAEGIGLDRLLRYERHLPLFRALGILNQVTRALAVAHAKGVVHRDLKPENLMLATRPGRREIIKRTVDDHGVPLEAIEVEANYDFVTILDFGAAKFWHQSISPTGQNATVIGTPAYMAPETARSGVADARSDIYSVGIIFYEMLTGTVPFDGDTAVQIMVKQVSEALTPPSRRNPRVEITAEAERVIMKALEKHPQRRYQTMEELNADLHRCYGEVRFRRPVHPNAQSSFEQMRRPIALTPDKMKRRTGTESIVPTQGRTTPVVTPSVSRPSSQVPPSPSSRPTPTVQTGAIKEPMPSTGSGPVRLTKRKSGKHHTLPLGVLPIPDDDDDK